MVSGTTTVTLTAEDEEGNISQCQFDLIVIDNLPPIISKCALDVTEQVDENCEFVLLDYTGLSTVTDNCSIDLIATQTPAPGTVLKNTEAKSK